MSSMPCLVASDDSALHNAERRQGGVSAFVFIEF